MSLLEIDELRVAFPGRGWRAKPVEVLHGVSLDVAPGETLGLVGESGSGKTTIGRAVLGLVKPSGGDIRFDGTSIAGISPRDRRRLSRDIQVVFQDPYTSLNPSMTIGDILAAAALSFVGAGAQPPAIEWGLMVSQSRIFVLDYLWVVLFPGLAIFITVLTVNVFADGVRDVLDPNGRLPA
jgi:ABC-type glutathione transport system ATPase component